LGQLAEADGDRSKALEYYNEAAELEEDPADIHPALKPAMWCFKELC